MNDARTVLVSLSPARDTVGQTARSLAFAVLALLLELRTPGLRAGSHALLVPVAEVSDALARLGLKTRRSGGSFVLVLRVSRYTKLKVRVRLTLWPRLPRG